MNWRLTDFRGALDVAVAEAVLAWNARLTQPQHRGPCVRFLQRDGHLQYESFAILSLFDRGLCCFANGEMMRAATAPCACVRILERDGHLQAAF